MKIGYMPISKLSWMTPKISTLATETLKSLKSMEVAEIVSVESPVTDEAESIKTSRMFAEKQIDVLILHFVTFPAGALIPAAVSALDCPVILLANPEKPGPGKMWEQNSFCGANLGAFVMKRLGKKYTFVRALPSETAKALAIPLKAVQCLCDLKKMRIGLVGGRVPGFYTSNFDEMLLRRSFGVSVEVIDLLEIGDTAKKLSAAEKKEAADTVQKSAATKNCVTDKDTELAAEMLASFKSAAKKYAVDTFAIRCWPEFPDIFGIAPCAVIGMLNDKGMLSSCEGDVNGAVTMGMLRSLNGGGMPIFVDLISYDEKENSGVIWHCGAAPVSLCRRFEETQLRLHMRVDGGDRKGVTNDFPLKAGRVTIAKLDQDENGKSRMLIIPGTAVDTEPFIRGNPLTVKFDAPVGKIIGTIIDKGFEHHYAAIHGEVTSSLIQFCKWTGIEHVCIEK